MSVGPMTKPPAHDLPDGEPAAEPLKVASSLPGVLSPEELATIEARANAATPGPWAHHEIDITEPNTVRCVASGALICDAYRAHDAAFIAHARVDVPALVAAHRILAERLSSAEKVQVASDLDVLRTALRAYQDAATDAFCAYRPELPGAGAVFRRFTALEQAASDIRRVLAVVHQGEYAAAAAQALGGPFSGLRRDVVDAIRKDLLARLRGEPGQIPEALR